MIGIWLYLGLFVFTTGIYFSWNLNSTQEIEQAALLPFADDPEVASRITQETGMKFDSIVNGTEQNSEVTATDSVDKFVA
ncbi:hypothetical protein [Pseudomonas hormoni]